MDADYSLSSTELSRAWTRRSWKGIVPRWRPFEPSIHRPVSKWYGVIIWQNRSTNNKDSRAWFAEVGCNQVDIFWSTLCAQTSVPDRGTSHLTWCAKLTSMDKIRQSWSYKISLPWQKGCQHPCQYLWIRWGSAVIFYPQRVWHRYVFVLLHERTSMLFRPFSLASIYDFRVEELDRLVDRDLDISEQDTWRDYPIHDQGQGYRSHLLAVLSRNSFLTSKFLPGNRQERYLEYGPRQGRMNFVNTS